MYCVIADIKWNIVQYYNKLLLLTIRTSSWLFLHVGIILRRILNNWLKTLYVLFQAYTYNFVYTSWVRRWTPMGKQEHLFNNSWNQICRKLWQIIKRCCEPVFWDILSNLPNLPSLGKSYFFFGISPNTKCR